jgi:signal transduction histidine kinase
MTVKVSEINKALALVFRQFRKRPWFSTLFALVCALAVATLVHPDSADISGTLGVILGHAAAGTVIVQGARRLDGRERLAWRWLGVGLIVASGGVLVMTVLTVAGADLPAFGPLDSFFLVSYGLVLLGILALPHAEGRWSVRARVLIDGLVGAVSVATLTWVFFLSGYLQRLSDSPVGQRMIAAAYPMLDVAILIGLLMLSIRRSTYWFDRRLLLISLAMIFQTTADLLFAVNSVGELFEASPPSYVLFIAASLSVLAAASIVHRRPVPREFADRPAGRISLIAPYGAAIVMIAALTWHAFRDPTHVPLLILSTVVVVVLTFSRQAVAIRENREQGDLDRQNLVSSVSHELRTPLTSMFGMLELLRAGEIELTDSERKEFLDTAANQARHMARIVSDLIILARDRHGTIYVAPAPCQLDQLIRGAVGKVEGSEVVEISASPMTVTVDSERFQQAIANLVGNAVKYGDGRVLVKVVSGENLVVEVHDDGPAVPTKYELVIWNRFERGPRRLDSTVPGSGNGLAIVAKVAEAHGGVAGYRRSEALGGACFFVSIPVLPTVAGIARIGAVPKPLVVAV